MGCSSSNTIYDNINEKKINLTLLGLSGSGKTTLIEFFSNDYDSEFPPFETAGLIIKEIIFNEYNFKFYDTGGLTHYQEERKNSILESDGIIFICDYISLEYTFKFVEELFIEVKDLIISRSMPILFLLTKTNAETSIEKFNTLISKYFFNQKYHFMAEKNLNSNLFNILNWFINIEENFSCSENIKV